MVSSSGEDLPVSELDGDRKKGGLICLGGELRVGVGVEQCALGGLISSKSVAGGDSRTILKLWYAATPWVVSGSWGQSLWGRNR